MRCWRSRSHQRQAKKNNAEEFRAAQSQISVLKNRESKVILMPKKKPAPKQPQPSLSERLRSWWTNVQVRGLQQAHTRELDLLGDPAHAAQLGLKDTYCRLA